MTIRTLFVLALAVLCGISAAAGVMQMNARGTAETPVEVEMVQVVTAVFDVPRGTMTSQETLTTTEWPAAQVPKGAMTSLEDAIDRSVLISLLEGEPVLERKLADRDKGRGIAPLVTEGMRAFTILTPNPAAGVAGFVLPGNRVDVLLTVSSNGRDDRTGGGSTTLLIGNVEILAVNTTIDVPDDKLATDNLISVTLLLLPEQVSRLTLAQNRGTLNLSLRNDADQLEGYISTVTMNDIQFPHDYVRNEIAEIAQALPEPAPRVGEEEELTRATMMVPEPYQLRIRTLRGTQSGQAMMQVRPRPRPSDLGAMDREAP